MLSRCAHGDHNECLLSGKLALLRNWGMDESDVEQICEAIFLLIPEVTRLKELFLCWSLLDPKERAKIDAQVHNWVSPERVQLYKPLREALRRWEFVQDTQGAPGCEPGMVSFSCDPQLEEEVVNVIYALESLLEKIRASGASVDKPHVLDYPMLEEVQTMPFPFHQSSSSDPNCEKSTQLDRERTLYSVQSSCYPSSQSSSFEDLSGYKTD